MNLYLKNLLESQDEEGYVGSIPTSTPKMSSEVVFQSKNLVMIE